MAEQKDIRKLEFPFYNIPDLRKMGIIRKEASDSSFALSLRLRRPCSPNLSARGKISPQAPALQNSSTSHPSSFIASSTFFPSRSFEKLPIDSRLPARWTLALVPATIVRLSLPDPTAPSLLAYLPHNARSRLPRGISGSLFELLITTLDLPFPSL